MPKPPSPSHRHNTKSHYYTKGSYVAVQMTHLPVLATDPIYLLQFPRETLTSEQQATIQQEANKSRRTIEVDLPRLRTVNVLLPTGEDPTRFNEHFESAIQNMMESPELNYYAQGDFDHLNLPKLALNNVILRINPENPSRNTRSWTLNSLDHNNAPLNIYMAWNDDIESFMITILTNATHPDVRQRTVVCVGSHEEYLLEEKQSPQTPQPSKTLPPHCIHESRSTTDIRINILAQFARATRILPLLERVFLPSGIDFKFCERMAQIIDRIELLNKKYRCLSADGIIRLVDRFDAFIADYAFHEHSLGLRAYKAYTQDRSLAPNSQSATPDRLDDIISNSVYCLIQHYLTVEAHIPYDFKQAHEADLTRIKALAEREYPKLLARIKQAEAEEADQVLLPLTYCTRAELAILTQDQPSICSLIGAVITEPAFGGYNITEDITYHDDKQLTGTAHENLARLVRDRILENFAKHPAAASLARILTTAGLNVTFCQQLNTFCKTIRLGFSVVPTASLFQLIDDSRFEHFCIFARHIESSSPVLTPARKTELYDAYVCRRPVKNPEDTAINLLIANPRQHNWIELPPVLMQEEQASEEILPIQRLIFVARQIQQTLPLHLNKEGHAFCLKEQCTLLLRCRDLFLTMQNDVDQANFDEGGWRAHTEALEDILKQINTIVTNTMPFNFIAVLLTSAKELISSGPAPGRRP